MNIRSNGGSSGGRRELSQLPFVRRSQSPRMLSDADAPKLRNPILIAAFEGAAQIDDDGNEFWDARDLAQLLEYSDYRNFLNIVDARIRHHRAACDCHSRCWIGHYQGNRQNEIGEATHQEVNGGGISTRGHLARRDIRLEGHRRAAGCGRSAGRSHI